MGCFNVLNQAKSLKGKFTAQVKEVKYRLEDRVFLQDYCCRDCSYALY